MGAELIMAFFGLLRRILYWSDGRVSFGGAKDKILAVFRDAGRALGPKGLDLIKPSANFASKETVGRVVFGT